MSVKTEAETPAEASLPPDELVIVLKKPIEGPAGVITEITLREPTAAQCEIWDKFDLWAADIMAVSVVSGVPKTVVEKMAASQVREGARYIARFLA